MYMKKPKSRQHDVIGRLKRAVVAHSTERDRDRRTRALAATWIVYHLGAALAMARKGAEGSNRGSRSELRRRQYALGQFQRIVNDIHYYVLAACKSCYEHHEAYMKAHPVTPQTDFELWVFELHNAVNHRIGKPPATDFEAVRDHYRGQLALLEGHATVETLSRALPAVAGRYCYSCG